jgi:branched-chain amino acid aminotransferase
MGFGAKQIWMDGELIPEERAFVPFLSAALHYGAAVFEGIRCYSTDHGPAVFRLKDHMRRLLNSAHIIGIQNVPYSFETLCSAVKDVIRVNGFDHCYIRPLIYITDTMGLNLDAGAVRVGIAAYPMGTYLGEDALEKGARANVSSFTRLHPNVFMTKAKVAGNYANSILAKTDSVRLGFDEAILLDPQGYVAECSGENIFLVRGGKIYSPPTAAVLEGITRDALLVLARDQGLAVVEQPVSRDQLYIAEEVFCCGTAAEVTAITEIDRRMIGSGKTGLVTRQLQQAFLDAVHGRHPRSPEWLDYVNE